MSFIDKFCISYYKKITIQFLVHISVYEFPVVRIYGNINDQTSLIKNYIFIKVTKIGLGK